MVTTDQRPLLGDERGGAQGHEEGIVTIPVVHAPRRGAAARPRPWSAPDYSPSAWQLGVWVGLGSAVVAAYASLANENEGVE